MFFYNVTDNPAKVSPQTIWESDGQFTRPIANLADLAVQQFLQAELGTPNATHVGTLPYNSHSRYTVLSPGNMN